MKCCGCVSSHVLRYVFGPTDGDCIGVFVCMLILSSGCKEYCKSPSRSKGVLGLVCAMYFVSVVSRSYCNWSVGAFGYRYVSIMLRCVDGGMVAVIDASLLEGSILWNLSTVYTLLAPPISKHIRETMGIKLRKE